MKSSSRKYLLLILIVGFVVALDQYTKSLVRNNLALGETWVPWEWLAPYARIVHWQNNGVVFGLFQGHPEVFTVLTSVIIVIIMFYYTRIPAGDKFLLTALSMQVGGAVGNLVDRLLFEGHVTDLISIGTFAVFNIADSSVTLGVLVLLVGLYLEEKQLKQNAKAVDSAQPSIDTTAESEAESEATSDLPTSEEP